MRSMWILFWFCIFELSCDSIRAQTARIDTLEISFSKYANVIEAQRTELTELRQIVTSQQLEIKKLKTSVSVLTRFQSEQNRALTLLKALLLKYKADSKLKDIAGYALPRPNSMEKAEESGPPVEESPFWPKQRGARLLSPPATTISTSLSRTVAFYAYLGHDEIKPSAHHTIIFDVVKTNIQNAYNKNSGIFTAPIDGVYAFLYTLKMGCHTSASFEILKNSEVQGTIHINVQNGCAGQMSTGNIITSLKVGDIVYIRTHSTIAPTGTLESNQYGWPYFSGWLISPM